MPRAEQRVVLLDTHALLWWKAGGKLLSATAAHRIEHAYRVLISPISCWEVGMLVRKGRIALDRPVERWVGDLLSEDAIDEAPLTPSVAVAAALLEDLHGDPADRIIVATALTDSVAVITKDRLLHDYADCSDLEVIW